MKTLSDLASEIDLLAATLRVEQRQPTDAERAHREELAHAAQQRMATPLRDRNDATDRMEWLAAVARAEQRDLSADEQTQFDFLKDFDNMDTQSHAPATPTNPTRAIGAPVVHARRAAAPAALLRGAIAMAANAAGIDTGMAREFDQEVRRRNPQRTFPGVAFSAKALLHVEKAVSALPGGNAAETTGDQWMDGLFFRAEEAIAGPRLAAALGVNTIVATEERVHITKLEGRVTPSWIARDADVPDSDATFDAVEVAPKTIGTNVLIKRSALLYGTHPQVAPLLQADMRDAMLDALDRAVLYGPGTGNQPTGIATVATPAVGAHATGPALFDLNDAFVIRSQLSAYAKSYANARWLLPELGEGWLVMRTNFPSTYTGFPPIFEGKVAGIPYVTTPDAPSETYETTHTSQQFLFGQFGYAHLVLWDAVSILANPYGAGYKSGSIELRVIADANVLVRDPKRLFVGQSVIIEPSA